MGAILINSNDSVFLKSIFELAKRFKGAKVEYIEQIQDNEHIFEKHPDSLTDEEAEFVVNTYLDEMQNDEAYTIEEVQKKLSKSFAKWKKDL